MTERAERPARPAARQSIGRKSQIAANARPPAPLCEDLAPPPVTGGLCVPALIRPGNLRDHRWTQSAVGAIIHQRTVSLSRWYSLGLDRYAA